MKLVLFAVALTLGGAAVAQVTNTRVQDGSAPELDARGIPVISAPAVVPAGANQSITVEAGARVVPAPNQSAVFTTQASTKTYVPCTREVTDGCVQTYEGRGARKATTRKRRR
ncbi:MAG TPA: hypothetical protein VGR19_03085 [Allosphingosinicella sp.]|nr:hypothetical protein [Allosphingosinicella sp.]